MDERARYFKGTKFSGAKVGIALTICDKII